MLPEKYVYIYDVINFMSERADIIKVAMVSFTAAAAAYSYRFLSSLECTLPVKFLVLTYIFKFNTQMILAG